MFHLVFEIFDSFFGIFFKKLLYFIDNGTIGLFVDFSAAWSGTAAYMIIHTRIASVGHLFALAQRVYAAKRIYKRTECSCVGKGAVIHRAVLYDFACFNKARKSFVGNTGDRIGFIVL